MGNFYFAHWISKYGKKEFSELTNKVYNNITVPKDIEKRMRKR